MKSKEIPMGMDERMEIERRLREAIDRIDRLEREVADWLQHPTVGERLAELEREGI